MSVLIGIVSKNRCNILPKSIDSGLMQKCGNVSIAVIDDNSTDDTSALRDLYPSVRWEFLKENKGYVFARNKFMKETNADYFCSLDDDSWFISDEALYKSVQYLNSHPQVAAVGFDILSPDQPQVKSESEPYETNNFIGCGHLLRLSAVRAVGFYDPNPSFYGAEEKDICLKFIDRGFKIVSMPGVHVWHEKTSVARDQRSQHKSGVCNDLVFLYRRSPFVFLIPGLLLKIGKHIIFSVRYKGGFLFKDGLLGIFYFLALLFGFKLKRVPVSLSAFLKYNRLNNISRVS